jgi:1-acyl-sn-glycerol-3-phosphate acyltransferase
VITAAFVVDLPLWAASRVLDPKRSRIHSVNMLAARAIVRLNPYWKVRVIGPDRLPPGRFVICANHGSNADIFCLSFVRGQLRYLAKRSLLRVPVFGWIMAMSGHVPIERGDRQSAEDALTRCREWLDRGLSVLFFPEGTRSETGEVGPFKMGAFKLAVDAGVPVLPIAIVGTQEALPKHGWEMREHADVRIRVLEPIAPGADVEALRDRVRAALCQATAELKSGA